MTTTWPTTPDGKWLVLRTVNKDWRSRDGFRWRKTVPTVAPDWDPDPIRDCGGGLHGLLWGCGDASYLSTASDAVWLVVEVDPADVADPDQVGKVRFRSGRVVYHGTRESAVGYLSDHGAAGLPVVYARHTAGNYGTATAGDRGTATAGYYGTATAGDRGTATAGDGGTLVIAWHDEWRKRIAVAYVGEAGIKADTPYRLDGGGNFVEVAS